MSNKKTIYAVGAVALVVLASTIYAGGFKMRGQEEAPAPIVQDEVFGAVGSPDIPSPWIRYGGVTQYAANGTWDTATSSVVCSIQNPAASTTTLDSFVSHISATGLGSQVLSLSTSTSAVGSSSPSIILDVAVSGKTDLVFHAGNEQGSGNLLGIATTGNSNFIWGADEYLNLRVATATPGTFSTYMTGTCRATGTVL